MIPERLQPILDDVRPLAERFAAAGHRIYLVGGIVRDVVLDRVHDGADLDLTTDARPEETLALLEGWADSTWTQGRAFGTIGARKGGVTFEVTGPFRLEPGQRYDINAVPYLLVLGPDGHATRAFRGEQAEDTLVAALTGAR